MLFPELFRKWADMIEADPDSIEVTMDGYNIRKGGIVRTKCSEEIDFTVIIPIPDKSVEAELK